jgi:hypothetical protein
MAINTFDNLDDLDLRGRVFSEMFPGTAASDARGAAFCRGTPAARPIKSVREWTPA